jgi:DNA primase
MTTYDNQVIRDIIDRLDIVEIIGEATKLTRRGNRYWGLCPFHQEKTPSFSVTPERNMFYCFGCHVGGDIFTFTMKREGIGFREALDMLADRAGVKQNFISGKNQGFDNRKKVIEVNHAAAEFFNQSLLSPQGKAVREYLNKRGIYKETILKYRLGYAPNEWNALEEKLLQKGLATEYIKSSGLIKYSEHNHSYYDFFRNRLIFPIQHFNGEIVGFGGRVLDESLPKYINTPETDIYSKRRVLYGLYHARGAIRSNNQAILLEGYMDCIKLQQAGIMNCVASLGTALTHEQANLLCRYTENVLILYDGDEAGQRETLRAIDILTEEGLKVEVITLPLGQDPDEFLEVVGKEEFLQYIQNNKINHIEFKINKYLKAEKLPSLEHKIRIVRLISDDIKRLNSVIEKDYYIKILSQKLMLEANLIYQEIRNKEKRKNNIGRNKTLISRDNIQYGNYSKEEKILASILKDPRIFNKIKDTIGLNFFARSEYKFMLNSFAYLDGSPNEKLSQLRELMQEKGIISIYARIVTLMEDLKVDENEVNEFIYRVQALKQEAHWQKVYQQIMFLKSEGDFNQLLKFILDLDSFLNKTREGRGYE